jgi:dTDP-4-amino-4,6-dideoxygalactose transaminase
MKFVDLDRQYRRLQQEIDHRVLSVLDSGRFILGPEVGELEQQLGEFVDIDHVIGVANGTDAISLALMALGIGTGHAVFVPSFTFFATAEAVRLVGAMPVFVDIDEHTYNLDAAALETAIQSVVDAGELVPKAIIAVDLFGLPADYESLTSVAGKHDVYLIEDAAQSFGGAINGKRACSFGDIATTSFFPAKPLGCYGDGGAVFTDDESLAEIVRSLRVHGQGAHKYDNIRIGMNSRLDTVQAAVLLAKLAVFEDELALRNRHANQLSERLHTDFITPVVPSGYDCAWAQYTVRARTRDRDYFLGKLKEKQIPSAVYYAKPLHLMPAFADLGYAVGDCPVSEKAATEVFSLPVHPYLGESDIEFVSETLTS